MDWDKLKSFYEIAISKSISKASAKLNISQSALSRQIQDLEYDLKTPLFIRHQKGVRLTEQGENLFNTVSQINNSVSSFEKDSELQREASILNLQLLARPAPVAALRNEHAAPL